MSRFPGVQAYARQWDSVRSGFKSPLVHCIKLLHTFYSQCPLLLNVYLNVMNVYNVYNECL